MNKTLVAMLCLMAAASESSAQIFYARTDNNGGITLRAINANGTGDTAIKLPFPKATIPTWSHDGSLLAVTAVDPARPAQITLNAWTVNLATGATQEVTHFQDKGGDTYSFAFAFYKAFSPNNSLMAVNSYVRSGGTNVTPSTTPILQLFPTNGDPGPVATLHVGNLRDEVHHDGEGVDWSSTQNVIAAPFKWDAPLQSGLQSTYGYGEATAIFLIDPNTGKARQLTVPQADVIFTGGFVSGTWAEEDYAPKFSPNGGQVAYVRSYQQASGSGPDRDIQSLRIIDLKTGAEKQVIQFQQGLYVSRVDWSTDGTQLVFDLGQQGNSSGFPIQFVDPATDAVYIVGVDGKNAHPVVGPPSGTPAWRPPLASQPTVLGNISTRMEVGAGENALIGGFIITGSQSKKVMIRALGPSLTKAGVQNPLADPLLELHKGAAVIATNDNWRQAQNSSEIPNGFAPSDEREAVLIATLAPGSYTAIAKGAHGETGVGLVEAYDLTGGSAAKLANISTRGFIDIGDKVMIGGFIVIGNSENAKVIVRAIGPSLGKSGVQGALRDPTLELHNGNGAQVGFNDDWQADPNANQVQAAGVAPQDAKESALSTTLPAGNYTVIVRGKASTTGIGLVEVYNVQ
jgi:hypothetical protein